MCNFNYSIIYRVLVSYDFVLDIETNDRSLFREIVSEQNSVGNFII